MSDNEEYETGDAGASHTFPCQAGSLKKGGYAVLKGHPCKIVDISTSKPGKHGHAKANIVGLDVFTDKKYEDVQSCGHNMEVPYVTKTEYTLCDINATDSFLSLMTEEGEIKADLKLPEDDEVREGVVKNFESGKETVVIVIKAMGQEQVVGSRINESAQ